MKTAFALAAVAGTAVAQLGAAPAGCSKSYSGNFEITIVKPSNLVNREVKRQDSCGQTGIITLNLNNGNLMDIDGRTGYIASNNSQFQFDKPVQAGGEYAGLFSVCNNGSIALGPTTNFYQCQSGTFYNLYYADTAPQCSLVNIDIIPCAGSGSSSSSAAPQTSVAAVSVSSDGQPQATKAATSAAVPVSMFTDGQPQATVAATTVKAVPVSEYTDGQPQATAAATAKSNITAASATPTIVTAGASQMTTSFFLAGAMAILALF